MKLRALLSWVAGVLIVSVCAEAAAQTTTNVTLVGVVKRRDGRQPLGIKPSVISLADCQADDHATFQISPIISSNLSLQVWGGTTSECANAQHLVTLDGQQCWLIQTFTPPPTGTFDIPVREILPHGASGPGSAPDTVCEDTAASGTGNGTVTVYFTPVVGNMTQGNAATYPMTFDMQGPAAPTGFNLNLGDGRLIPTWTAASNTDISSYKIFCEPADVCTSTFLKAGEVPGTDLPAGMKTSTSGPISTSGDVEGLENGQLYICAMAGVDALGNVGVLSETDCGSPKAVDGYYKTYRAAGGTAGGGYCSFGRAAANPALPPLLFGALGVLVARRKRRRSAVR